MQEENKEKNKPLEIMLTRTYRCVGISQEAAKQGGEPRENRKKRWGFKMDGLKDQWRK